MENNVQKNPLVSERRRSPRFSARERALVAVVGDEFGLPYHLIDISEGGMAFRYLNKSPLPLTDVRLDIYLEADLCVGRLPVTVVADRQLEDDYFPKRRCCVAFGKLTPAQEIQLQTFIQSHTRSVQASS